LALSAEIAEGLVFANASRAHMAASLGTLPAAKRADPEFFIGNRIRTCISDDVDEARDARPLFRALRPADEDAGEGGG
jgi:hypothetical protein